MQRSLVKLARSGLGFRAARMPFARMPLSFAMRAPSIRFASNEADKDLKVKLDNGDKKEDQEASKETKNDVENEIESGQDKQIEDLQSKLAQKDKELAEMKNFYTKALVDFRSLQESTKKEIQKAKDFALQKFSKELLDSLDNFNLALNAVKAEAINDQEFKNLYDGVYMTKNVFEKTLNKYGIEKIEALDKQFDPNLHEATFEIPQPEKEPGTVFYIQQDGYTLNSRVLRPTKVGVVKDGEK